MIVAKGKAGLRRLMDIQAWKRGSEKHLNSVAGRLCAYAYGGSSGVRVYVKKSFFFLKSISSLV